jgi:hypothetical protein
LDPSFDKLALKNVQTRSDLEDQGIYVGLLPDITSRNHMRLLKRLMIIEPQSQWFINNTCLELLPDPLSYVFQKPLGYKNNESPINDNVESQTDNQSALTLHKPHYTIKAHRWKGETYKLVIDLAALVLNAHPLMLPEESVVINIKQWINTVHNRNRNNLQRFLDSKLYALKKSYNESKIEWEELQLSLQGDSPSLDGYKRAAFLAKQELAIIDSENKRFLLLKEIKSIRLLRVKIIITKGCRITN